MWLNARVRYRLDVRTSHARVGLVKVEKLLPQFYHGKVLCDFSVGLYMVGKFVMI